MLVFVRFRWQKNLLFFPFFNSNYTHTNLVRENCRVRSKTPRQFNSICSLKQKSKKKNKKQNFMVLLFFQRKRRNPPEKSLEKEDTKECVEEKAFFSRVLFSLFDLFVPFQKTEWINLIVEFSPRSSFFLTPKRSPIFFLFLFFSRKHVLLNCWHKKLVAFFERAIDAFLFSQPRGL